MFYLCNLKEGVDDINATIKDVAKNTGLSIATVSKFINGGNVLEKNRLRLEAEIIKLDFKVNEIARGLKTKKTMTIGILIPTLENYFFTQTVSNMENILIYNRYSTIICVYKEDKKLERAKLDFLISKKVDGIVIVPLGLDEASIRRLSEMKIAVVLIDRPIKGARCDTVLTDNQNASYNAVKHLIIKGHKRIGIICGPQDIYTAKERLKGYIKAHEEYSLAVDSSLIKLGDYYMESGYKRMNEYWDSKLRPTAVFVTNYDMTLGAIIAINERNIAIPDDLSLIGFDSLQLAKIVKPALSIAIQPMKQIGETAASLLLSRLKNDFSDFPSTISLGIEVLLTDSVKEWVT